MAAVTVIWKELRFHVSVVRYALDQRKAVDVMLKTVFEYQLKIAKKLSEQHAHFKGKIKHYFIPFSASDVALLERYCSLVNSRFSLCCSLMGPSITYKLPS